MTADTFTIHTAHLTPKEALNLASKLLQYVTQQPGHAWATKTPAETWSRCCDQFEAELAAPSVVAWIRKNGPGA